MGDTLIPVLNITAFSEAYFTKCASYGLDGDQAMNMFIKQSGFPWEKTFNAVKWPATALATVLGTTLGLGGKVIDVGSKLTDLSWGLAGAGLAGGAGVGGLAWLLNENAKNDAAKAKATASAPTMDAQVDELRRSFAPAQEPKAKTINTAKNTSSDFEV